MAKPRLIAYWTVTLLVVFENVAGFVWTILHIEYLRVTLAHLGYPPYFANMLGPWQLACAAALIAPRFPLVKEWAYAGAFFNYSAAVMSRVAVGDHVGEWFPALVMVALTIGSWALRPPDRRLARSAPARDTRLVSWIVPAVILAVMFVVSLLTLPPPPKY